MTRRPSESGSATVFAVAFLGLLLVVAAGLFAVTGAVVAHRRAQAAADLAALAAAQAMVVGGDACAEAGRIAAANAAAVTGCRADGRTVLVTVTCVGPTWWGRVVRLSAQARAGPE